MRLTKTTNGFVQQVFDTVTKKFISQEFIAGDETDYEDEDGNFTDSDQFENAEGQEAYLPFDMRQPVIDSGTLDHEQVVDLMRDWMENMAPEELVQLVQHMGGKIQYLGDSLYEVEKEEPWEPK